VYKLFQPFVLIISFNKRIVLSKLLLHCQSGEDRTDIANYIFIDIDEITAKVQLCQRHLKHYIKKQSIIYVILSCVI